MSNEYLQEVRDFQKSQVDAVAQAALSTTDHLGKLADIYLKAGKELIATLQSHSQEVLSTKDLAALAQANSSLVNTLLANGVKVSQDVFTTQTQYAQHTKEQVTTAVSQHTSNAGTVAQAVQQSFAKGAQAFGQAQAEASSK